MHPRLPALLVSFVAGGDPPGADRMAAARMGHRILAGAWLRERRARSVATTMPAPARYAVCRRPSRIPVARECDAQAARVATRPVDGHATANAGACRHRGWRRARIHPHATHC